MSKDVRGEATQADVKFVFRGPYDLDLFINGQKLEWFSKFSLKVDGDYPFPVVVIEVIPQTFEVEALGASVLAHAKWNKHEPKES